MVDQPAAPRARQTLQRLCKKSDRGSRRAEDNLQPICRAAKRFAARRAIAKSTHVLEETVAWQRRRASPAERSHAAEGADFSRRAFSVYDFAYAGPDVAAAWRRRGRDPFHDADGGLQCFIIALLESGR